MLVGDWPEDHDFFFSGTITTLDLDCDSGQGFDLGLNDYGK